MALIEACLWLLIAFMLFMADVFGSLVELFMQMVQLQLTNSMYRDN